MELIEAVEDNDVEMVIGLLNSGVDINYQEDTVGESPLMTASRVGQKNMLDILLNAGADVNLIDYEDANALFYAISGSNFRRRGDGRSKGRLRYVYRSIVKTLLDNGIDYNVENEDGNTALMEASRHTPYLHELIMNQLIKARQRLAFSRTQNMIRGMTGRNLEPDVYNIISKYTRSHRPVPSVHTRMQDERRRDPLTKSRQRLATMRGLSDRDSVFRYLRESELMENVSRHLSRIRPIPSVQKRMLDEERLQRLN